MTTTETYGRWIFGLERDGETTTRTISIPAPKDPIQQESVVSAAVDIARNYFVNDNVGKIIIQPANWRDNNDVEEQWTTTELKYEVVSTSVTPF